MTENITEIIVNTNITTQEHFDRNGNSFSDYSPLVSFKSSFRVKWQLFTETPGANSDGVNVASWTKAQAFAGCGALLTCDNDYRHRLTGTLKTGISSGVEVETLDLTVSGVSMTNIPQTGYVTLLSPSGNVVELMYSSRTVSGSSVTMVINGGFTPDEDFPAGSTVKVSQEVLFQSVYNAAESIPAEGLFVFDAVAYSNKLAALGDNATNRFIPVQGLEILPYKITTDNQYVELPGYILDTFAIAVNMGEAGQNPQVPEQTANHIAGIVQTMISSGFDVELYNSATGNWEAYSDSAIYSTSYTKYRFRLASAGNSGEWAVVPLIHGSGGGGGGGDDYSAEINALNQRVTTLEQSVSGVEANLAAIIG